MKLRSENSFGAPPSSPACCSAATDSYVSSSTSNAPVRSGLAPYAAASDGRSYPVVVAGVGGDQSGILLS
ncbi:hypothetical protein BRD08_00435 [Halobacteriales archaeon SW_10_66_29]|nr:MAG: hypothetical protein BRD08_00435 [Halobacteriales archaeon SW_10_66_29]